MGGFGGMGRRQQTPGYSMLGPMQPRYGGGFGGAYQQPTQPTQPSGGGKSGGASRGGGGYQAWPGFGMGGMPSRFGGLTGYQSYGQPGAMFGGFSGPPAPYGPGSYSSPGAMPYGGGSGMYGGRYNQMAGGMAGIPPMQYQPYQFIESPQAIAQRQQQAQRAQAMQQGSGNPMNPNSGCYYDSSQDDYICPGR